MMKALDLTIHSHCHDRLYSVFEIDEMEMYRTESNKNVNIFKFNKKKKETN